MASDDISGTGVRVRRAMSVFMELSEEVSFDFDSLLRGGDGMSAQSSWCALAPHLDARIPLATGQMECLRALSARRWMPLSQLAPHLREAVQGLIDIGLVFDDSPDPNPFRAADERYRAQHWHPLGGLMHAHTRWEGVDAVANMHASHTETATSMRRVLGAPPVEAERRPGVTAIALSRSEPTAFDALLHRRVTCRNFDSGRSLPLALFSQLMQRVFAAQAEVRVTEDTVFLKKNAPSGGGLHPTEAYLVVQNVDGVAPGLYHYQATDHALEPLPNPAKPLRDFMMDMVGQQHWFADAHVMVLLSPRFGRTFWKYRQHAKGYRVVTLEAGHLSQTLYLSATEAGLGAFITAAINEVDLERAFGLDPVAQGALAVCGFGWRADAMENPEFDPAGVIWKGGVTATQA